MTRALLDTSAVVAYAQEEVVDPPAEIDAAISIVTLCELYYGVLSARDDRRADRLRNLTWARHRLEALPAGDELVPRYGQLMLEARLTTGGRPPFADTMIAATAMTYGLPVLTRDKDFLAFRSVEVILI